MNETRTRPDDELPWRGASPEFRPSERFWPYVEPSEAPTPEELADLDPDLHDALFGQRDRPFSVTLSFRRFVADDYDRAVTLARKAPEYREFGTGADLYHRARYFPENALALRDLFEIVGSYAGCEVLVDDRPVPFARELWLPLMWLLIPRD